MQPLTAQLFLTVQWQGAGWCTGIALLVFLLIHAGKLLGIGLRALRKKKPEAPPPPPEKKPEPVYFIVERKKKRAPKEYAPPKEISFR